MNTLRTISRFLVVTALVFVGNACAFITYEQASSTIQRNQFAVTSTFVADLLANKNEHAKKAFVETVGHSLDVKKDIKSEEFVQHLVFNYGIRKSSELLHKQGITANAALKAMDVLPSGIVRDVVNSAVEGVVELATHPETLTLIALSLLVEYSKKS